MSEEKIMVAVDEDLEELIPGFLKNRTADVQLLNEAIEAEDIGKIQSIGHSLKGVGGGYGFDGLSELGAKIEIAAKEKNVSDIKTLVEEMADYMARVEVVYE
jgi:HPt (histidine-containing phosphotransfer) domain-containing protein